MIYCRLSKSTPENSERVSNELLTLIEGIDTKGIMNNNTLFMLLKNKRYISPKIYRKYWEKIAEDTTHISLQALDVDSKLSMLSHRYCLIQKGMINKYRCKKFEMLLKEFALFEVKYGSSAWKPRRLSKLATFLIGFAHDPTSDYITLPEYFVRKVEKMSSQYTINEIIDISIGIENFHRNGLPKR